LLCYDERDLASHLVAPSIFLAGPTQRGHGRTPWRAEAIELFRSVGFAGVLVVPEFRDRAFADAARVVFAEPASPVPAMKATSYNILAWETCGIERASVVLFWMPFSNRGGDSSLPGFTTRAEVSRELVRDRERIVLGMPPGAWSSSHIRYHAHHAGVPIHATLAETVAAAVAAVSRGP
jgi:hypothetical protein